MAEVLNKTFFSEFASYYFLQIHSLSLGLYCGSILNCKTVPSNVRNFARALPRVILWLAVQLAAQESTVTHLPLSKLL
jgi:hypothetical protein